jgi:hypothetical protein
MRVMGVLAIVGVLSSTGATAAPPAAPTRPPERPTERPNKERRLHLAGAEASSFLVNDWNKFQENYLPLYVGDDDPTTTWNLKTEGIGEWLRMRVTQMEGATKVRMKIRNGYQKSPRLFEANSRAKDLTVVLLPSNKIVEVALADQSGWQEIAVEQAAGPLEAVELRVKSVFPGKKYDDLCISDVQVYVTATSTDNPAFEKQRLTKIIEWKKDRVAAAKLFRTQLGQSLPIGPQYAVTRPDAPRDDDARDLCPDYGDACRMSKALSRAERAAAKGKHAAAIATALELTRTKFAAMTAVRVSVRDKRPLPAVDGLCTPNLNDCDADPCESALPLPITGQVAYLNAEALALVEQSGLPSFSDVLARKPPQCSRWQPTTFAWALRDASTSPDGGTARLRALLLVQCGMVSVRDGAAEAARPQLLVYGADGRLEVVSGTSAAAAIDWDQGPDGAKLARASITGELRSGDMRVEAAVAVANK